MSLLKSTVTMLAVTENRVIYRDNNPEDVLTVSAVALVIVCGVPIQLLCCEGIRSPFVLDDHYSTANLGSGGVRLPVVVTCEALDRYLADNTFGLTPDDSFGQLFSHNGDFVKLLDFLPTETIYPVYGDTAHSTFSGIETFRDERGIVCTPRMLIQLMEVNNKNNRFPIEKRAEKGDVLILVTTGHIHEVTLDTKKNVVTSLGVVGHCVDYAQFLQWSRDYQRNEWVVGAVWPMPYGIAPEPATEKDGKVMFTRSQVLEMVSTLVNDILPRHVCASESVTMSPGEQNAFRDNLISELLKKLK